MAKILLSTGPTLYILREKIYIPETQISSTVIVIDNYNFCDKHTYTHTDRHTDLNKTKVYRFKSFYWFRCLLYVKWGFCKGVELATLPNARQSESNFAFSSGHWQGQRSIRNYTSCHQRMNKKLFRKKDGGLNKTSCCSGMN